MIRVQLVAVATAASAIATAPAAAADPYDRLYQLLPPGYQANSCEPNRPNPPALASVRCGQNSLRGGPTTAVYTLLPNVNALNDWYWATMSNGQRISLTCPGPANTGGWYNTRTRGFLDCGHTGEGADVLWQSQSDNVLAAAFGPDLELLFAWWTAVNKPTGY